MSTTEQYRRLGIPTRLLGLSHGSWTIGNIRLILNHYKQKCDKIIPTKLNLMHELHLLVQEYDLEIKDRMEILNASKRGEPLPRRKPKVRKVPHPTFPKRKDLARARNQAQAKTASQVIGPNVADLTSRDCAVCFETLNPQNTPKQKTTSSCNHEMDVCISCLTTSISTQLDNKVWDHIDCPTCAQRLEFQDVKAFADPVAFGRLDSSYTLIL